jgi:mannosylglycoprotein endo-beta-mannosidase
VAWHDDQPEKILKRVGANVRGEYKKQKKQIMAKIQRIDEGGGDKLLSETQIRERQDLETKLEKLMEEEEIYWQQRGGEKWVLEGDSNTTFFHLVANGRRRKKSIISLQHEGVSITDLKKIQEMIYGFYKNLFGSQPERKVCLAEEAWARQHRLTPGDNEELLKPFTLEEVKETVFEMKEEVAPGPDGFGVSFYKKHWGDQRGADGLGE